MSFDPCPVDPVNDTGWACKNVAACPKPCALPVDDDAGRAQRRLARRAADLVISTQFGSTRMLQRRLRIGHPAAAQLMTVLEENGVVGPHAGERSRDVLVRPDQAREVLARSFPLDPPSEQP